MEKEKMRHIDIRQFNVPEELRLHPADEMLMGVVRKAAVRLVEDFDNFIADGIIEELEKEGFTDVFLLDRRFVIDAIREKAEREKTKTGE